MTEVVPTDERDVAAERAARRQQRARRQARAEGRLDGICAMLRPGDLALDCGANVGAVTARLAETGCDVVAYEPDPWAFERLSGALGCRPNVRLVNAALAATSGTMRLRRAADFADSPRGASVKSTLISGGRSIDDASGVDVPVLAFADELARHLAGRDEIAFVKMDIEGAELEILEPLVAGDGLARIRTMLVETHERKFKALRPRFRALRAAAAHHPARKLDLDWI